MQKRWHEILFIISVVGVVLGCLGLVLLGPLIGQVFFNQVSFKDLTWSPDSRQIAFLADLHTSTTSDFFFALYVVDADGDNLHQISDINSDVRAYAWSPDSRHLAVLEGVGPQLLIYTVDGKDKYEIPIPRVTAVSWSPDGTQLAVMANQDNSHTLYVVNADGSSQSSIYQSEGASYGGRLVWSPDGEKIAVRAGTNLMVVRTDGTEAKTLSTQYLGEIQWAGDKITFHDVDGTYEMAVSDGEVVRVGDAPPYEPGVISPDGEWRAKVGCGDPNSENTQNVDVFSCMWYELHVTRVSDDDLRFKITFNDLQDTSLKTSVLLAAVAFGVLIGPALSLPYFYIRKNFLARLLMLAVIGWYGVVCLFFLGMWATR